MINFDFHTHTKYSHGSGTVIDNAVAAQKLNMTGIAITDHGFSHPAFGMKRRLLDRMKNDCVEAEKQTGVKVLLGIESNILGTDGKTDVRPSDYAKLDVFLAGVHKFVLYDSFGDWFKFFGANYCTSLFKLKPSARLIKNTTEAYVNAIKNNPIDVITHVCYGCFADCVEVAKCCADYGTYMEINTKKIHLSDEDWQNVIDKTSVRFVVDSDAHSPSRVGDGKLAEELFARVNFPRDRIMNIDGNTPVMRFAEYKRTSL